MTKEKEIEKLLSQIKSNLLVLDGMKAQNDENYAVNYLKWVFEVTEKNRLIYLSKNTAGEKDQEVFKKQRKKLYWIDFGKNIGSEFNGFHFAVVIKDSGFTSLVVPISTEKETTPEWKENEDLIVPIGELQLPADRKPSYALIHQMCAVSKKRLSRLGNKREGYYEAELTDDQMDLIDTAIKTHLVKQKTSDEALTKS